MCGISGIVSWKNSQHLRQIIEMTDLIRHRGPDDEGFALFSHDLEKPLILGKDTPKELGLLQVSKYTLALGHRRLSILDLSALGHQPMSDPTGRYWIVYNGEVYNYLELRLELEALGAKFLSHTDTEVILQAYIHWGERCLQRFNGMFSFLLYDLKTHTLFGARDRFAVKPFYWWVSPEGFIAFASEIKQFTTLSGWSAKLNGQAAYDFLNWGITNNEQETCFQRVYQLQGGHYFIETLHRNTPLKITPKRWYTLAAKNFQGSFKEASFTFKSLLEDAIALRCRSDVPVGSCLSGGLDSSSIVCLANQFLKNKNMAHQQVTFSACSHYKEFDEREYIDEVVKQTQVASHLTFPDLDALLEKLDLILWHQDEPFGSTSIFAQWEVFELVKKHGVKVMLDGQGADEQLAGYSGFHATRFKDLAARGRFFTLFNEMKACRKLHGIQFPMHHLANQFLPQWIKEPIRKRMGKITVTEIPWLNLEELDVNKRDPSQFEMPVKGALQRQCYAQITKTSLPMLLHFEDRDSMAHSIEARTPFLDYRLVEFLHSLPSDFKLASGISKRVLREGLNGVLPEKIRQRISKLGFATPEEVWVKKQRPDLFKSLAEEACKNSYGILNQEAMKIAEEMILGKRPFSFQLWRMIIFGRWIKRFNVSI
jgi:asparagine synthase (glutamine-hydrolysing)